LVGDYDYGNSPYNHKKGRTMIKQGPICGFCGVSIEGVIYTAYMQDEDRVVQRDACSKCLDALMAKSKVKSDVLNTDEKEQP
jgi:hypothetical protein